MVRNWIREFFGLEKAVKRQQAAVAHEADLLQEQARAKEDVTQKTNEVLGRVEELRKQTEVTMRKYPELRPEGDK